MGKVIWLLSWFAPAVPNVASIRGRVCRGLLTRKMTEIKKSNRIITWTEDHEAAYAELLMSIKQFAQRQLNVYNPEEELWMFVDASEKAWSKIVIQCTCAQLNLPVQEQVHKPIIFLADDLVNLSRSGV